jgi:hypothetical protein
MSNMQPREPGKHTRNPRDAEGAQEDLIKSQHRKNRDLNPVASPSLKEFARTLAAAGNESAQRWLHNKRVNTSKPPLGTGSTRKKKGNKN